MNKKIKIVFAGTPQFAVPYLEGFFNDDGFEVLGVITQPDRPAGRKQELTPPPIKILAEKRGVKIWQPENLKNDLGLFEELKNLSVDVLAVVAYGQIIPKDTLKLSSYGGINVHPSLLPKYRGASPIQNTILNGEKKTGVSIMQMDEKMDHGPILAQQEVVLNGEETNESLHQDLAEIGVPLLLNTIKLAVSRQASPQEQNHEAATFCSIISREQSRIDWQKPAQEIKQMVHAFYPWPIAWTTLDGQRMKIYPPVKVIKQKKQPGQISTDDNELIIGCGQDSLIINKAQLAGKKEMTAKELLNGYKSLLSKKVE